MIHPSRLPLKRPPTVAEFIERLQACPQDALLISVINGKVLAPETKKRNVYRDARGNLYVFKVDSDGPTTPVAAVSL